MKKIIFILMFALIGLSANAQQITFQKIYGIDSNNIINSVAGGNFVQQTSDGGYILTGQTALYALSLIKTNANGDTLWTRALNVWSDHAAFGNCVQQTSDGGYIIAGGTADINMSVADHMYLVKTDSGGDTLWTKAFGVGWLSSVQQTTDGGYIIVGGMEIGDTTYGSTLLLKTNNLGDTLWSKIFVNAYTWDKSSVQQTIDGGYILTGYYFSNTGESNIYLIKTNSTGDTLWTKTYGGRVYYEFSAQQTTDGGYIIAGTNTSSGDSTAKVYVIKTDSIGDLSWSKTYGGNRRDAANSIQQTNDGGYIIAGNTTSFGDTLGVAYLIKTNTVGDTLWTRTYGGTCEQVATSVQQTNDGGYIITGNPSTFISESCNTIFLIKTDSNGIVGCNEGRTQTVVATPSTQVSNLLTPVLSGFPFYPLSPLTQSAERGTVTTNCINIGINEIFTTNSITLYPNPTFGTFTFSYKSQTPIPNSQLKIYDVLGQEVYTQAITNPNQTTINVSQLSNGVYFYQLTNGTETYRGKFIKQ